MRKLEDFNFEKKKVLLRCDFNVPLSEKGEILDDFRIRKTLPTIEYLQERGAKLLLISHLGRPLEIEDEKLRREKFSLKPVAKRLTELLGQEVKLLPDCLGQEVEREIEKMKEGEVVLLENLRFHKEEKELDEVFAQKLAKLGDIFIQEAFATCHRTQTSIVGIPKYLISGMGLLLEREIKVLTDLLKEPKKPLVGIIGGKKVEAKSKAIDKISEKADWILINSLIQKEIGEKGIKLKHPQKIIGPIDSVDTLDIGPKTINLFKEKISQAKTIFWSGPLGKIEEKEFSKGSEEIAKSIVKKEAFSVVGGGETVEFINRIGLAEKFDYVSTGGGALLEFLSGKKLPGIEALKK